jgi:hypothetical protein
MFVGAPLAFWSTRIAAAVIENASPRRVPVTAAGAAMVAVAALAAWLPTRRATRVEPVTALRSERAALGVAGEAALRPARSLSHATRLGALLIRLHAAGTSTTNVCFKMSAER